MSKIKIVMLDWFNDLHRPWLESTINQYFEFEHYQKSIEYDKSCIFLLGRYDLEEEFIERYLENGYKLLVCNLWEAGSFISVDTLRKYSKNVLVVIGATNTEYRIRIGTNILEVPNWFWYNESLMITFENIARGYVPNRTNDKLFLLPMRRHKPIRDEIFKKLEPLLDNAIYSYQFGPPAKELPRYTNTPVDTISPDRVFEKEWYDQTYFSIVVETSTGSDGQGSDGTHPDMFITEKIFKPIAYKHPFMVLGIPKILNFLRANGFETYDHIFDESYDTIENFIPRLNLVYNNILSFDVNAYNDPLTEQKILHNYNHFFNATLVNERIVKEIIEPIIEWANE